MLKKTNLWLILLGILIVSGTASLILYKIVEAPSVFLETYSPKGTYTVTLFGQKERPIIFTNEVRFNAFKNNKPYWLDQYLHSGDSFDLSFESGYPNHQWLNENILHFYRGENFTSDPPTEATLINNTNNVIKYMKFESQDKFLLFDIQPNSQTILKISPPKGDYPGVRIEGKFSDEQGFKEEAVFDLNKNLNSKLTFYIIFTDNGIKIESPFLAERRFGNKR